jgi:hypothetical protein
MGAMTTPMIAPESSSGFTKRDDIQLLPNGLHPGVIYAVCGIGTHMESFNGQPPREMNKIHIGIEFPQLKQMFYMEDTVPRSTVGSLEGAFAMTGKSKLKALVEAVRGVAFNTEQEASNYDISQLLGCKVLCNMTTVARQNGKGNYNKILNFAPLGTYPLPPNFNPENEYNLFVVDAAGENFKTTNYANLPNWLKKTIMESVEAKKYASKGGAFAKKPDAQQNGKSQQPVQQQLQHQAGQPVPQQQQVPQQQIPPVTQKTFVLTNPDYTMEQWRHAGWNEEALVAAGHARWDMPLAPASAPQPQAPPALPPQQTSQPPVQQMPQQAQPQGPPQIPDSQFVDEDDDLPY